GQNVFDLSDRRIADRGGAWGASRSSIRESLDQSLHLPDRQAFRGDAQGERRPSFVVWQGQEGAGVTGLDPALSQQSLHVGRQRQEPDRIGDMSTGETESLGEG